MRRTDGGPGTRRFVDTKRLGTHRYEALPVSPFFTVNIGYEHSL